MGNVTLGDGLVAAKIVSSFFFNHLGHFPFSDQTVQCNTADLGGPRYLRGVPNSGPRGVKIEM